MSTCIGRHGEYSAHTVGEDFYCEFCGVFDEQAAVDDAYARGRAEQAAADRERIEAVADSLAQREAMYARRRADTYAEGARDAFDVAEQEVRAALDFCGCPPCPGRGNDGHGLTHCAECCFGSGVEADPDCPTHGRAVLDSEGGA
jgi:hypothetical protein